MGSEVPSSLSSSPRRSHSSPTTQANLPSPEGRLPLTGVKGRGFLEEGPQRSNPYPQLLVASSH